MKTQIFKNLINFKKAAEIIKSGGLIAFPTETVYGLGADGFNETAVKKIFEVKGRANDNPLILHVANFEGLMGLTAVECETDNAAGTPRTASPTTTPSAPPPPLRRRGITSMIEKLYEAFMPGALTLVVPKNPNIPDAVTCGLETVAVRVPSHPIAREFIAACGVPIAAPSANISGKPSCTAFEHVFHDMNGKIEGIIDGGSCDIGLESTILDLSVEVPTILRLGGVSVEAISEVIGEVEIPQGSMSGAPKAPGMKYRHYAPEAPLYIVDNIDIEAKKYNGKKIGKLYAGEDLEKYANELFDNLRKFDNENVDVILVEKIPNIGIGRAINNRLEKASKH